MNKNNKEKKNCNFPNCESEGDYRAPLGYENLDNYQWFCLEHIKEFNKSWNYHNKMNSDEIENEIRYDTIWRRPTKSFGSGGKFYNFTINGEEMGSFENPNIIAIFFNGLAIAYSVKSYFNSKYFATVDLPDPFNPVNPTIIATLLVICVDIVLV